MRIASVTSLIRPYLHQAVLDVLGDRADIPLVIDVENSRHIWDMVERNRYDLGLVFAARRMSGKNAFRLHGGTAFAAMSRGHRLSSRKVTTPADLVNERVILPGRNSPLRLALDRAFSHQEHQPASTLETAMLNCRFFAAAGMGVGIVDAISLNAARTDAVAIPFEPRIEVACFAISPPGSRRSMIVDQLIDRVRELTAAAEKGWS